MTVFDLNPRDALEFISIYVVPGLVAHWIRSHFVPKAAAHSTDVPISYLSISLIWFIFSEYILSIKNVEFDPNFIMLTRSFIGPAIFGLLLGFIAQLKLGYKLGRVLRLPVRHPTETAWDFVAQSGRDSCLIVTLRDGRVVYGYCGKNSFFGDAIRSSDFFIEEIYEMTQDGHFRRKGNSSMLILPGEISTVEFVETFKLEQVDA